MVNCTLYASLDKSRVGQAHIVDKHLLYDAYLQYIAVVICCTVALFYEPILFESQKGMVAPGEPIANLLNGKGFLACK
jgi:hypothetical protein